MDVEIDVSFVTVEQYDQQIPVDVIEVDQIVVVDNVDQFSAVELDKETESKVIEVESESTDISVIEVYSGSAVIFVGSVDVDRISEQMIDSLFGEDDAPISRS